MKIDLLQAVMNEADQAITNDGLSCKKYYFFEGKWFELETKTEVAKDVAETLDFVQLTNDSYYVSKEKTAWFYINEHSAIISIQFKSVTRVVTRKKYRDTINSIVRNATNAYNVSHNGLTGLYSREHFRALVKIQIDALNANINTQFNTASESEDYSSISLLSFDIDKFKQVNDTYGHLYGDQVLKAFAMRLEEVKEQLQSDNQVNTIELAHPSGEEFFALIVGKLSEEEIRLIAEKFRGKIENPILPSDSEWAKLNNKGLAHVILPPSHERTITASVGVTTYSGLKSGSTSDADTMALFDKADIALYRSKAGGRNRVTLSQEILQKCGRVLDHDQNTGVVAIDIGSKVGVLMGQEFRVFPPMFSGNIPYVEDDGRSKKTKGYYPKVETGRIVVFNSQKDISFAFPSKSNKTQASYIPKGSLLEAVPLGHITHLIENSNNDFNITLHGDSSFVLGWKEFKEHLKQLNESSKKAYAAVFRFRNESEFLQKYGSAALNRALAQLYSDVKRIFGDKAKVGIIDKTSISVIGEATISLKERISEILAITDSSHGELETICGYCSPNSDESEESEGDFDASPLHVLELARFTASNFNTFIENKINQFSVELAERNIANQRSSQAYSSAIADYNQLKGMGVTSALLENSAGLCYSAMREYVRAKELYEMAVTLDPKDVVYRGNYAIMAYRLNEIDNGLEYLSKLSSKELVRLEKVHPYGYIIYAFLLEKGMHEHSKYFDGPRFIVVASQALQLKDSYPKYNFSVLERSLVNFQEPPAP